MIRTWYFDGPNTHGITGLASVDTEAHANYVGVGPDEEFTGTAMELARHLRDLGYTEVEIAEDDQPVPGMAQFRRAWAQTEGETAR